MAQQVRERAALSAAWSLGLCSMQHSSQPFCNSNSRGPRALCWTMWLPRCLYAYTYITTHIHISKRKYRIIINHRRIIRQQVTWLLSVARLMCGFSVINSNVSLCILRSLSAVWAHRMWEWIRRGRGGMWLWFPRGRYKRPALLSVRAVLWVNRNSSEQPSFIMRSLPPSFLFPAHFDQCFILAQTCKN